MALKSIGSVSHTCPTEQCAKSKLNYVSGLRTRELIREECPKRNAVKSEPSQDVTLFALQSTSRKDKPSPEMVVKRGGTDLAY